MIKILTSVSDFTILNQQKGMINQSLTTLMRTLNESINKSEKQSK
jgi:hypothetical protein